MRELDRTLSERDPDTVRFRKLADFYRARLAAHQAPGVRANLSDADLRALMLAGQLAAFYSHEDDILNNVLADLRLLEHRGDAKITDFRAAYGLLIANRRFDEARLFLDAHAELDGRAPPRLLGLRAAHADSAAEMRVGEAEGTLEWVPVDVEALPRILVIAHPSCHFTQNAAEAIESDPALNALFTAHAKWLAPQDTTTDFSVFTRWNAEHPDMPITVAYRSAGFPMIDNWSTPTFYFIDHGRVVSQVTGWPRGGQREEIFAVYREAFPPSQSQTSSVR